MELMQNQKEQWSGVVKRAEETGQNFKKNHCQNAVNGTNLIVMDVSECGNITK
jgi:hypothetical protein